MVAIKTLSVLAVAGSAVAAPAAKVGAALVARDAFSRPKAWNYNYSYKWGNDQPTQTEGSSPNVVTEDETVVVTQYVHVPYGQGPPQQSEPAAPAAPAPSEPAKVEQPQPQVEQPTSAAPAPAPETPAPSPSASSGGSSDSGYMGIVNEYRAKMGLPNLEHDSKLESNAQDTSDSSGGQLKHKLNPGSMGQVMAPGQDDMGTFEHVFVGGWICEIPSLLPGDCSTQSQGWDYQGQTGHAEILTDAKYTKIGCGCGDEMWTCDLA